MLEIWLGSNKCLSVRWGKIQPLRCLLSALAVVKARPGHHLILMTTAHHIAGKGCIRAIDTPDDLALPRGGTLSMHYVPFKPDSSPAFLPTQTVAWQILRNTGVYMWDKKKSRRRFSRRVRSRGSRRSNFHSRFDYNDNNQNFSFFNET